MCETRTNTLHEAGGYDHHANVVSRGAALPMKEGKIPYED